MTRFSLQEIVAGEFAELGLAFQLMEKGQGRVRSTTWFAGERGIGLRQYVSGRKMYVVQARMSGRLRTVTLGSANVLTRYHAIAVGRRVLARALVGSDPAEARIAARNSPSMDDFMGEYWEKCSPGWKASTVATCTNYRESHIDGAFPDLFIDTLSEEQVVRWFVSLTDRAGPAAANRCIDILHAAMNKAEAWGYRSENSNPCRDVRRNRRIHRKRFLSVEELGRLGSVLLERRASPDGMVQTYASAITLLILTGCRVGEILGLKWSHIRGLRAHLRDGKAGPRTVWLGQPARDVLDTLPRHPRVDHVFWNSRYQRPVATVSHVWCEIRKEARLTNVRLHDLRHTYASHAALNRESLPMIGKLLGHAKVASTARYAHLDDAHLLDAAEIVGSAIGQHLNVSSFQSSLP